MDRAQRLYRRKATGNDKEVAAAMEIRRKTGKQITEVKKHSKV